MADKMQEKNNGKSMSFWEHIKELRTCIAVITVTFLVAAFACYYFAPEFVIYVMSLAQGYTFVQTGVAELMAQYIKVSLIAAVVADIPVIVWQVVKFVGPGLTKIEERCFLATLFGGLLLFAAGVLFAVYIVLPFTLQFFLSLNTIGIGGMYSIKEYIGYVVSILFSFGLIFEIPIVTAVLTGVGMMKPHWMKKSRRIVIVLCVVIGAIITPPDVVSQIMVALPMYLLFELGVIICSVIYKSRRKKLKAQGLDPDAQDENKNREKAKIGRWAAAKSAVEKNTAEKRKSEQ